MLQANIYRILKGVNNTKIIVAGDAQEALGILEVCKYCKATLKIFPDTHVLGELRAKRGDDLRSYSLEMGELLLPLGRFYRDSSAILIAPLHSILHPLPKPEHLRALTLSKTARYNLLDIKTKLLYCGFEESDVVHAHKEIALHGDIIDIFPLNYENPIRISFFDDEIEGMRFFDIETQMCFGEQLENIEIIPAFLNLTKEQFECLDIKSQNSDFDAFNKDIISLGFWFIENDLITSQYPSVFTPSARMQLMELKELSSLDYIDFESLEKVRVLEMQESYSDVVSTPQGFSQIFALHKNKQCTLLSMNELLLQTLLIPPFVRILQENITLNIATPDELILSINPLAKPKKKARKTIVLNELNKGDFVVHSDYGIGIFDDIVQRTILGNTSDFIQILYAGNDALLLPTHNLHLISKYIATTSSIPIVDKLGRGSFSKIKERVRPKLFEIAKEIVDIAAQRELIKSKPIDVENVELEIFKHKSNFTLTPDQERSIKEIFDDFKSLRVMDRLLIGDVGFGKTEVAMNAIFAVVKSGLQAALIAPTTLLSHQHFNTLKERFSPFGVHVARFDRFSANKNKLLQGLKNGSISIVVGTHGLLNAEFGNLRLVVLDEEHKFGVKQKESLKNITKNVHVLSMSATPIPRTLNLALSSIKTKSELNTPPEERIAPKTFVKNYNEFILKDAILRELRRNGQIFYIHNNIASIQNRKNEIASLLPKLKIAILHSKIPQKDTEEVMIQFANGHYDMLLSTSIIESGIHLPNANTILVDSADCFGMADLHQLRGRVGRGKMEGYCYFFVDDKENITPEARKRLLSLESNSFLGAGGILSYADLELRGGGNILGDAQSGHIKHIGYSLYLTMLEECINTLSGREITSAQNADIKLNISAFLNASLIPSNQIRLDFYRRLSHVESSGEIFAIEREIVDRFGKLDSYSLRFLQLILVKFLANSLRIKSITNYNQRISVIHGDDKKTTFDAQEIDDESVLESVLAYLHECSKGAR